MSFWSFIRDMYVFNWLFGRRRSHSAPVADSLHLAPDPDTDPDDGITDIADLIDLIDDIDDTDLTEEHTYTPRTTYCGYRAPQTPSYGWDSHRDDGYDHHGYDDDPDDDF